jgi:hypothetical protein
MMWDDHEVANDAWATGAENHNEGEGSYDERVYNAMLAYHDWNPTREPGDQIGMARIAEIGDLATLAVTESRHVARDQPMDFSTFPIPDDADPDDPANQQAIADWRANEVGREDREMLGCGPDRANCRCLPGGGRQALALARGSGGDGPGGNARHDRGPAGLAEIHCLEIR